MYRTAYIILLLTALFWGGNTIAGKLALGHVSPMTLNALRWTAALAIMVVIGYRQLLADRMVIKAHLPFLLTMGAVGFTLFNVSVYTAVIYTTAINVSILQAAVPAVVFAGNFALFGIRLTISQLFGFVLTIAGVVLIASRGDLARLGALEINIGDALMVVAVIAYGGYTIALRYMPALHWQSTMFALSAGAALSAFAFAAVEYLLGQTQWPDGRGWLVVLYTAIFPSILAQTLYIKGNRLIGGNRAGIFVNLVPVFGTLLSIIILGERFHIWHAGALAFVFSGIWLAERGSRRQKT